MTARHRDTTVPLGCSRLPQSPDGGRHRLGRLDADGELILSLREALDRSLAATAKLGPSMSMPLRYGPQTANPTPVHHLQWGGTL